MREEPYEMSKSFLLRSLSEEDELPLRLWISVDVQV